MLWINGPGKTWVIRIRAKVIGLLANNWVDSGLEVISCGANVPFKDPQIFYGPIAEMVDQQVSLIPDFIANCGMARAFAYFMDPINDRKITDHEIFMDISETIHRALAQVHAVNKQKQNIAEASFQIALETLI